MRAAAAVAVVLVVAACGRADDSEARRTCMTEAENTARAAVVVRAFEAGRLGTRRQVEADFPGGKALFDEQGHMLPYSRLEGLTRARFDQWVANDDYLAGPVQSEAFAAARRVRDGDYPGC